MRRIDTLNKAADLFGTGKHGWKNGTPGTGDRPTEGKAEWFNSVQEEIARFIEGLGFALDPGNASQMLQALQAKGASAIGIVDIKTEVTLTTATALDATALGKAFLLSDGGGPVNYQVTLPGAAAVGSLIMVRVSSSATRLYTVHGNDVPIDGQISRVLWAGESALLVREGGGWYKLSGRSVPMVGGMRRTADQAIPELVYTQVTFTGTFGDPTGLYLPFSVGSGNFLCCRDGSYQLNAALAVNGTGTVGAIAAVAIVRNASTPTVAPAALSRGIIPTGDTRFAAALSTTMRLVAGDGVGLVGYMGTPGSSRVFEANAAGGLEPTLTWAEIPSW